MNITFKELETTWKLYVIFVFFVIGSIMGSFLYCIAYRIVQSESITNKRSHCDICGKQLTFLDLIPILSYLFNKGRCKYCNSKIGIGYLLSECISGVVFVLILLRFDFTLKTLKYLVLACCLLGASFTDIKKCIIPDSFVIVGVINRLIFILLGPNIILNLKISITPALLIGLFLTVLVLFMQKILQKEVMGFGDVKLITMLSLYGSLNFDIVGIFVSSLIGIAYCLILRKDKKDNLFPFGQCISCGFFIVILIGESLINSLLSLLVI